MIKARNTRPKLEDVLEETTLENLQMSQKSPEKQVRVAEPKMALGIGSESKTIYLKLHKEELERGVFMSSNKAPILTLNQHTTGPNPMPFNHYRQTGMIL